MLLGIFRGTSVSSFKRQQQRIRDLQAQFSENRQQAIADVNAGINELQQTLRELQSL